jgi:hypothetical protein
MDIVTHKGVDYKKATLVAKEFGYTTDYIGQLCRAEKVDARLVGRAWYVNTDSLEEHKKSRYKADFEARVAAKDPLHTIEEDQKETTSVPIGQPTKVEPVLKNKTVRMTRHFKDGFVTVPVNYVPDEGDLMPSVAKVTVTQSEEVAQERPRPKPVQVRIPKRKQSKPTVMRPEELPEVLLKGKLSVEEAQVTPPVTGELRQGAATEPKRLKVRKDRKKSVKKSPAKRYNPKNKSKVMVTPAGSDHKVQTISLHKWSEKTTSKQFAPTSVQEKTAKRRKNVSRRPRREEEGRSKGLKRYLVMIILLLSIFIAFLALTLRVDYDISDGSGSNALQFELPDFSNF